MEKFKHKYIFYFYPTEKYKSNFIFFGRVKDGKELAKKTFRKYDHKKIY